MAEDLQQRTEVQMMTTPDAWPLWPWLPVKLRKADGSWPDTGIVRADETDGPFVIHEWNGLAASEKVQATFDSAQDAVNAGWVVD